MVPRREGLIAALSVAAATMIGVLLRGHLSAANLAVPFLLAVVAVAGFCGRRVSMLTAIASVGAFDFFCVPPFDTFAVDDSEYLVMFGGMLAVALVIQTQSAKARQLSRQSAERAARTEALSQLVRGLAQETRAFDAARTGAETATGLLGTPVVIFLPQNGRISFERRTADHLPVSAGDLPRAQQVFESGRPSPAGERGGARYFPLRGTRETYGVMAVVTKGSGEPPLAELIATQVALALERIHSQAAAEDARFKVRTEQMRSSLLSAVSHDLRSPLAAITGSATTLRTQDERLDASTRAELIENISEEAARLERLVSNLLDMTRFESGAGGLRSELVPLEEIVGAALHRLDRSLAGRQVTVNLPEDLPLIRCDDVLLGQLLWNLLENAAKYTPPGSPIAIEARSEEGWVTVDVCDRGPGIPEGDEERIFEKFFRGERPRSAAGEPHGAGLGLPICRAIAEAHGGSVKAIPRPGGGVIFRIRLPLEVSAS